MPEGTELVIPNVTTTTTTLLMPSQTTTTTTYNNLHPHPNGCTSIIFPNQSINQPVSFSEILIFSIEIENMLLSKLSFFMKV
jgi:hypothetical protein